MIRAAVLGLMVLAGAGGAAPGSELVATLEAHAWGFRDYPEAGCTRNPHRWRFTRDGRHAEVRLARPAGGRLGPATDRWPYRVVAAAEDRLLLLHLEETAMRADGTPLMWVVEPTDDGLGYLWIPTDAALGGSPQRVVMCDPPMG